jgi:hypothetical protein
MSREGRLERPMVATVLSCLSLNTDWHSLLRALALLVSTVLLLASSLTTSVSSLSPRLYAIADAHVSQSHPDANYGGQLFLHASDIDGDVANIWLMFDTSSLAGVAITSALLYLNVHILPMTALTAVYYSSDNSWNEFALTWSNQPSSVSSTASDQATIPYVGMWYSWKITADVLNSISSGRLSIVLRVLTPSAIVDFSSRDSGDPPYLSIAYASGATTSTPTVPLSDHSRVHILSPDDNSIVSGMVEVPVWYNAPIFPRAIGSCGVSTNFMIDGNRIYEGSTTGSCDSVYPNQTFVHRLYTTEYSNGQHVVRAEMKMYHPDLGWFGWWYDEIHIIIANPVTTTSSLTRTTSATISTLTTTVTPTQTGTTTQTSAIISTTTVQITVSTTVTSGAATTIAGLLMQVVSNSSVSNLVFDSTRGLLNLTVSGASGTYGFFDATIAKGLLLGQPVVLIDGAQHSASITEDANFWHVHVTYTHSQHHVTIGGSNAIPEFPSTAVLAVVLTFVIIVTKRRRE